MIPKKPIFILALVFAIVVSNYSLDTFANKPVATDSRIRTLVYSENEVFQLVTKYGYQSNIELGRGEQILTLSIGNPVAFKVTPSGNRLFVKSLQSDRHTNMTVLTNRHAYQFEISSVVKDDQDVIYVMRFYYPEDDFDSSRKKADKYSPRDVVIDEFSTDKIVQENYNYNYSLTGPDHISPLKIFDDGKSTYLKFGDDISGIPSLYAINPDGTESPLIARRDGEYIITEKVFSQLALRKGPDVVCIFNDNRSPIVPLSFSKPVKKNEDSFLEDIKNFLHI